MDEERLRDEAADLLNAAWDHRISRSVAVEAAERLVAKAIELGRRKGARNGAVGPTVE